MASHREGQVSLRLDPQSAEQRNLPRQLKIRQSILPQLLCLDLLCIPSLLGRPEDQEQRQYQRHPATEGIGGIAFRIATRPLLIATASSCSCCAVALLIPMDFRNAATLGAIEDVTAAAFCAPEPLCWPAAADRASMP